MSAAFLLQSLFCFLCIFYSGIPLRFIGYLWRAPTLQNYKVRPCVIAKHVITCVAWVLVY